MSNNSIAAALAGRLPPMLRRIRVLDRNGNVLPNAPARLSNRESTTDAEFLNPHAKSRAPLPATAPHITVVASGATWVANNASANGDAIILEPITTWASSLDGTITEGATTDPATTASSSTAFSGASSSSIASSTSASPSTALTRTAATIAASAITEMPAVAPAPPFFHAATDRLAVGQPFIASSAWAALPGRTTRWQARANFLLRNADQLRRQFQTTQKATTPKTQKATRKVVYSERGLCQMVDRLLSARRATCIHFDSVTKIFTLPTVLARARHVTIKLDASGVGRERFLYEVLPALARINTRCPVVLVARNNGLTPYDVGALVDVMQRNAVVYRLDLSDNLLCEDEEPCLPLVELFQVVGPTSHLYLSNCGVNGATARRIAETLPANPCITHLDLRGNAIDAIAAAHLAQAAGLSNSLAALRLHGNEFDEDDEEVMLAVEAANRQRSNQLDHEQIIISLPIVQTSAVDPETMMNEAMCELVQHLLDAAAAREQL
jgi:hypothetical protein